MTPPITASTRYTDLATARIYYLPTIAAATLTPTRAEMGAGTNLTPEISDLEGWVVDCEYFDTQNMESTFRTTSPGTRSTPNCSLTFYASRTGIDVRSLLSSGTNGFIMFLDAGDFGGNRAEVWPIAVGSTSVLRTGQSSSPTAVKIRMSFGITGTPAQSVTVPM